MNHNATNIDHILTNCFDSKVDTEIVKVQISDHFPIVFISKLINVETIKDPVFVTKRVRNLSIFSILKENSLKVDMVLLHTITDPNEAYKKYVFSTLYEILFPKIKKLILKPSLAHG